MWLEVVCELVVSGLPAEEQNRVPIFEPSTAWLAGRGSGAAVVQVLLWFRWCCLCVRVKVLVVFEFAAQKVFRICCAKVFNLPDCGRVFSLLGPWRR